MAENMDDVSKDGVSGTGGKYSVLGQVVTKELMQAKSCNEIFSKNALTCLYAAGTFEELNLPQHLMDGLHLMNFVKPSLIQKVALPILLKGQNMIAQSQSGTGKTATFLLATLYHVDTSKNYPQAIIIAPTFELALQISDVCRKMSCRIPNIKIRTAVRGEKPTPGVKEDSHILIGTPGKLIDWAFKFRTFDIKKINIFVLDEADVLISLQGMRSQATRIRQGLNSKCQMLFFSATFNEDTYEFAKELIDNDNICHIFKHDTIVEYTLPNIRQIYFEVGSKEEKFEVLRDLYDVTYLGQLFIFTDTRQDAHELVRKFESDKHCVGLISGDLTTEERHKTIQDFRKGDIRILVATNVMARGIDIDQARVVVNYDLPKLLDKTIDFDTYVHRIGRTGRFGKQGLAINFVESPETLAMIQAIENHFEIKMEKVSASDTDTMENLGTKI